MHKIFLICKREYLSRVKKRSFLLMTLLSPLLIALFYGMIFYFSINKSITEEKKIILVCDESARFENKLENSKLLHFQYKNLQQKDFEKTLNELAIDGILWIQDSATNIKYELISKEQPGIGLTNIIENKIEKIVKNEALAAKGISENTLDEINNIKVNINTQVKTKAGYEKSNTEASSILGFLGAFLIYFFIFLYGVQVMKGVIEEKTNRIVEVIISSVKPFQLMMGKIIGIALVGITQFTIWILLILLFSGSATRIIQNKMQVNTAAIQGLQESAQVNQNVTMDFLQEFESFNIPLLLVCFLFYFIGGYLFYGALFAAVGSAVDSETDTQQFMMPITLPLIFSIVFAQHIINDPNSSLAIWLSMIPFTSPIIMMVRLPFGIPPEQLFLSMLCLVIGFIGTVWFAGKIYRIGILTYGKKPSYKEIIKWLFRKN